MGLTKSTQAFVQKMIDASLSRGDGYINILSLGCKVGEDISKVINKYLLSQPVDSFINLFIPPGTFYVTETIYIVDRVVNIKGAGRGVSVLLVSSGQSGFFFDRKKGLGFDGGLRDVTVIALAKIIPGVHGVKVWVRAILNNVEVQGFSGNAVHIDGYTGGDPNQDADHNACFSKVMHCYLAGCENGIEIQGRDGNACVTFANDIRNNRGWGLWDSSLLGGTHIGNMFHANALGPYKVDGQVNASAIFGGYIENDHGPNQFPNELVKVFGGYNLAGNEGGTVR